MGTLLPQCTRKGLSPAVQYWTRRIRDSAAAYHPVRMADGRGRSRASRNAQRADRDASQAEYRKAHPDSSDAQVGNALDELVKQSTVSLSSNATPTGASRRDRFQLPANRQLMATRANAGRARPASMRDRHGPSRSGTRVHRKTSRGSRSIRCHRPPRLWSMTRSRWGCPSRSAA